MCSDLQDCVIATAAQQMLLLVVCGRRAGLQRGCSRLLWVLTLRCLASKRARVKAYVKAGRQNAAAKHQRAR